jgi:hypothetical protein
MFEEMAIGVKMALTGNPTRELENFTRAVRKATEATEAFSEILATVNKNFIKATELLAKLNPTLKEFNASLALSSDNTKGLNTAFTGLNRRLDGMSERMTKITRKASMLAEGMEAVTAATGAASVAATAGFGTAGFTAGRGGRGHGGGVHVRGTHFGPLGFSGAAIGIGAGLMLLHSGYEASKTYQQVLSQIILQNIPGTNANQINQFVNGQNIPGVSKLDLLQKLQDALVVSKNIKESEGITPFLSQIGYANEAIFKGTKQELKDQDFYSLVKGAELITGSMDPAILKPVIDEMVKINNATSGQVKPTATLQMLQKTRGALRGADPRVLYQLEPIEQEYGGSATGVMVRALYQHLQAGRLTTAAAMQLEKMHLIKPGFAEYNKIGMIKRVKPGGVVDQDLLNKDFMDWYSKYFISYFQKNNLTPNQEKMVNSVIFTNSDLALANAMVQQQAKIAKTADLNAHAMGTAQMLQQVPSQSASEKALSAAYFNFKKALGDLTAPSMISAVNSFAWALNKLAVIIKGIDAATGFAEKVVNALPTPASAAQTIANAVKSHVNTNPAPSTIVLQLNNRELGRAVVENLNQSMYHAQIQQSNSFMPGMTPIQPNTGVPYR